jgi:hypothetical protein
MCVASRRFSGKRLENCNSDNWTGKIAEMKQSRGREHCPRAKAEAAILSSLLRRGRFVAAIGCGAE